MLYAGHSELSDKLADTLFFFFHINVNYKYNILPKGIVLWESKHLSVVCIWVCQDVVLRESSAKLMDIGDLDKGNSLSR